MWEYFLQWRMLQVICLNRLAPLNVEGYVEGIRKDCQIYIVGKEYGIPPVLANMLIAMPTVTYLRQDILLDVLFGINDVAGYVDVRFREALAPGTKDFMSEKDLLAFLDSGTEEFLLRRDWEWLQS